MSYDPWEYYNPFEEEDEAASLDLNGNVVYQNEDPWEATPDPFGQWGDIYYEKEDISGAVSSPPFWWPVANACEALGVPPTDQLIDQLTKLSISDIQKASALRAKGLTPLEVINELQLLFPGTPTQQLCQIAGFVEYADTRQKGINQTS